MVPMFQKITIENNIVVNDGENAGIQVLLPKELTISGNVVTGESNGIYLYED
jgi:nitrous oxidase accessory protein NosD